MKNLRNYSILLSALFMLGAINPANAQIPIPTAPQTSRPHTMQQQGTTTPDTMLENRSQTMLQKLGTADQTYDKRFIDMMIPHHQEAVTVGEDVAKNAKHPQLRQFAQKMMEDQKKEIQQLQTWRKEWYGQ